MNVTVTREEIDYAAAVLRQLRVWEKLLRLRDSYNRGTVSISIDGNGGKESVQISCDVSSPVKSIPADLLKRDIEVIVGDAVADAIEQVVGRLKKEMPLPLDK